MSQHDQHSAGSFGATSTEDSSRALMEQIFGRFPALAQASSQSTEPSHYQSVAHHHPATHQPVVHNHPGIHHQPVHHQPGIHHQASPAHLPNPAHQPGHLPVGDFGHGIHAPSVAATGGLASLAHSLIGHQPAGFPTQPAGFPSHGTLPPSSVPNTSPLNLNSLPTANSQSVAVPASVQQAIELAEQNKHEHPIAYGVLQETFKQLHVGQSELRRFSFAKQIGKESLESTQPSKSSSLFFDPQELPQRAAPATRAIDPISIRKDFPALHQSINGHDLVWFDNAATTHKPQSVIDAVSSFYSHDYSNIHRAAHTLAARATDLYEAARETVRQFIHAGSVDDIVFVRGTTEGINFIANVFKGFLHEGDEILLSEMEHHANIVPWQLIARETRARIRVIPFDDRGELMMDEFRRLISLRTKIVSVTHASNTLGTILPVEEIGAVAKKYGAKFVIDGAQSIAHLPIDVTALDCDFFVFSGHKVYSPTGIGVVYVRPELQDVLPPWQGGGNMIHRVTFDETTYAPPPNKFEAGTPSIGDAIGLGAALQYLRQFDIHAVASYEHSLLEHAIQELSMISGVRLIGGAMKRTGLVSFTLDGFSTEQVGRELDRHGIAVRTGHHCAQPSLRHFGLESTIRPSFAIYNTHDEIDRMISVIRSLKRRQ